MEQLWSGFLFFLVGFYFHSNRKFVGFFFSLNCKNNYENKSTRTLNHTKPPKHSVHTQILRKDPHRRRKKDVN